MQIVTLPDITGTGALQSAATVFGLTSQPCKWLQVTVVSNASNAMIRLGDSGISATRGIPLGAGTLVSQFAPQISEDLRNYDLKDLYFLIPSGDKLSLAYGV